MTVSFRKLLENQSVEWMDYCYESWERSSRPRLLEPSCLFSEPIVYGENVYRWFEERYEDVFLAIFMSAESAIRDISIANEQFMFYWRTYFDPWSLWKQLRTLLVFSTALQQPTDSIQDVAAAYIVAQGVPSNAVDKVLDTTDYLISKSHLEQLTPFCLIAYNVGLELIRKSGVASRVEDILLHYSRVMYAYMWKESTQRYFVPVVTSRTLENYINGESRLLSSVFYSITIDWAYAIAGIEPGSAISNVCKSFRRVRQLNDEIMDIQEDLKNGIVTFPILHSLASVPHGKRMRSLLDRAWQNRNGTAEMDDRLTREAQSLMVDAGSFDATAHYSLHHLSAVMHFVQENFDPRDAFEMSLVINQRLATLLRHADAGWRRVADLYNPQLLRRLSNYTIVRPSVAD